MTGIPRRLTGVPSIREVEQGLGRWEFVPYYQPVVALTTGVPVGYELLARWQREGELVPPEQFIPLLERAAPALLAEMTGQVLHVALPALPADRYLGVNLSPAQLRPGETVSTLLELARRYRVMPRRWLLEITESHAGVEDVLIEVAGEARDAGFRLALDDFGTGYASLEMLRAVDPHVVKIDQTFVRGMLTHTLDRRIVGAVVQLADALGLDVVAEGVESAEIAAALRMAGCHAGQGYFFGRPAPNYHI